MITAPLPAVYRLAERTEADGLYRDYRADDGRTWTVKATSPVGVLTESDTAAVAARAFARSAPGRLACPCPVRIPCLGFAVSARVQWGIWGGTTPAERDAGRPSLTRGAGR